MQARNADIAGKSGIATVTFSSKEFNMSMGFEAVPTHYAASVMAALSTVAGKTTSVVVKSPLIADNTAINNPGDGGDNMEMRLAVLENDVSHIKADISDLKTDVKKNSEEISEVTKDVAVILQKLVDIDANLSKKPSTNEMTTAITTAVNKQIIWTIVTALGVLGLAKLIF